MRKLCKFTLTWEEKRAIQDCCTHKCNIHHRAYKRAIKNPSGRGAKDDEVQEKHLTLMQQYNKLDNMFAQYNQVGEDYYFEEYLGEEEEYKLLSFALVAIPKGRGPEFFQDAENALTKIGENFI